jgi:hypothetical protein
MFNALGRSDPECGHQCGECGILEEHQVRCNLHVSRTKLLASGRSTSRLLSLFRTHIVRQRVADMSVGTLAEKKQRFEVCLQRANCRLTLEGVPYGFRPVFLRFNRVWMRPFSAGRDCMDLVLDFLLRDGQYLGLATPSTDYTRSSTCKGVYGSDTDSEGRVGARVPLDVSQQPLKFKLLHCPGCGDHYSSCGSVRCWCDWAAGTILDP